MAFQPREVVCKAWEHEMVKLHREIAKCQAKLAQIDAYSALDELDIAIAAAKPPREACFGSLRRFIADVLRRVGARGFEESHVSNAGWADRRMLEKIEGIRVWVMEHRQKKGQGEEGKISAVKDKADGQQGGNKTWLEAQCLELEAVLNELN